MKLKALLLLPLLTIAQTGFGSDGVIMKTIQDQINSVVIKQSNGAVDSNATVYARFGFAMGLYGAEKRVVVQNMYPAQNGVFSFKKYNDQNVWQDCTVKGAELGSGKFVPACQ